MKKLMFAAATAAMSAATFAATPAAQVYDVTFNIKTTKAASAKNVNNKTNPIAVAPGDTVDTLYYRAQTSITWKGLIWGCNCEAIDGVWELVNPCVIDSKTGEEIIGVGDTVKGCIVWDVKGKAPVYMGEGVNVSDIDVTTNPGWEWDFLNLINKDGKGAECVFDIIGHAALCEQDKETFDFRGAGFGNVQLSVVDGEVLCNSYVKKVSGNFAGWMCAPTTDMVTTKAAGCSFCGKVDEEKSCDFIEGWEWCNFGSACGCDIDVNPDQDRTAAYGTWTIAYNSSLSKKLSNTTSILNAYNFKSLPLVSAAIATAEAQIRGDVSTCDELEAALKEASAAVIAAEKALDAVSEESLKAAVVAKDLAVAERTEECDAAAKNLQYANEDYYIADAAYERALYQQTNVHATVIWKNASQAVTTNTMVGCTAIAAFVAEKKDNFTLIKMETTIPGLYGIRTDFTWAQCTACVKDFTDATATAKANLVSADAAVVTATANAKTAAANLETAKEELAEAQKNLANMDELQTEARVALKKAESVEATAQAAYDAAGCND